MKTRKHFFIIGVQRSGTTFLYNLLARNSQICMAQPINPEPKYFINKNHTDFNYEKYITSCFPLYKNEEFFGEKGTSYIEYPDSGITISKLFPNAKIIIALRNPVYRAISNYFFSLNNGIETRTIEEVFIYKKPAPIISIKTSVSPFDYLKRGRYIDYIKEYITPFTKENVLITFYEEFTNSFEEQKYINKFLGSNTKDFIYYKNKVNSSIKTQKVSSEIISLLNTYFRPYNNQLSVFIKNDLKFWNNK